MASNIRGYLSDVGRHLHLGGSEQSLILFELQAHIEDKTKERKKIQDRINKLNDLRNKFVAAKRRELSESDKTTLETAIIKAIHTQCEKKHFVFAARS